MIKSSLAFKPFKCVNVLNCKALSDLLNFILAGKCHDIKLLLFLCRRPLLFHLKTEL